MVWLDIGTLVVIGGIKGMMKMELNKEIKEIFDKFQGGYYYYSDTCRNVEFVVETDYYCNDSRILVTDKGINLHASIELRNGGTHIVFSDGKKYLEGHHELASKNIIDTVQKIIVDYKHHLEENGFNVENYDDEMCSVLGDATVSVSYIRDTKNPEDFEKGHLKKLDDMNRIVNEEVKLFWID